MKWTEIWKLAKQHKLPEREDLTRSEHHYITTWMQKQKLKEADVFYIDDNYMIVGLDRQ